jgi:hypothetical protein
VPVKKPELTLPEKTYKKLLFTETLEVGSTLSDIQKILRNKDEDYIKPEYVEIRVKTLYNRDSYLLIKAYKDVEYSKEDYSTIVKIAEAEYNSKKSEYDKYIGKLRRAWEVSAYHNLDFILFDGVLKNKCTSARTPTSEEVVFWEALEKTTPKIQTVSSAHDSTVGYANVKDRVFWDDTPDSLSLLSLINGKWEVIYKEGK